MMGPNSWNVGWFRVSWGFTRCRIKVKIGRCRKFLKVLISVPTQDPRGYGDNTGNAELESGGTRAFSGSEIPGSELAPSSRACRSLPHFRLVIARRKSCHHMIFRVSTSQCLECVQACEVLRHGLVVEKFEI